jgi:hypothetical protein
VSGYTALKIDDIEGAYGGAFKRVRASLGVESFGMQIIDMPPNADQYPEHDHAGDGQEEVYLTLAGGGVITIAGDAVGLDADTVIRVGPGVTRKVAAGPDGLRLLVVGGVAGKAYDAPEFSKLEGGASL